MLVEIIIFFLAKLDLCLTVFLLNDSNRIKFQNRLCKVPQLPRGSWKSENACADYVISITNKNRLKPRRDIPNVNNAPDPEILQHLFSFLQFFGVISSERALIRPAVLHTELKRREKAGDINLCVLKKCSKDHKLLQCILKGYFMDKSRYFQASLHIIHLCCMQKHIIVYYIHSVQY